MGKAKDKKELSKNKKRVPRWAAWVGVIIIIAGIWGSWDFYRDYQQTSLLEASEKEGVYRGLSGRHHVMLDSSSYQFRESKAVVDPMRFPFKKQFAAYSAAHKHSEVMDQLYCYCACEQGIGHKSLLSCFADNHGANCGICMDEALLAAEMTENGAPVSEIADALDDSYKLSWQN
ncbi:MAG: hypothetical protein HQM13_20705 [SAR324 cluster bacterium]|nr:hypothetical protein [SAR324 cluster bacterium]